MQYSLPFFVKKRQNHSPSRSLGGAAGISERYGKTVQNQDQIVNVDGTAAIDVEDRFNKTQGNHMHIALFRRAENAAGGAGLFRPPSGM